MKINLAVNAPFDGYKIRMQVNLDAVCNLAGKRMQDLTDGHYFVDYPVTRAKKLLRMIRDHATDDLSGVADYLKDHNRKLWEYWGSIYGN